MPVKEILMEPFYFQSRFISGIQTVSDVGNPSFRGRFSHVLQVCYLYHSAIELKKNPTTSERISRFYGISS